MRARRVRARMLKGRRGKWSRKVTEDGVLKGSFGLLQIWAFTSLAGWFPASGVGRQC